MKIEKSTVRRFMIFGLVVILLFSALLFKLYDLQVVNADQYQQSAETGSYKTIRLTGKRGMITDAESVVLAMSEDIYNLTFLLSNTQLKESYYKQFTPSILQANRGIIRQQAEKRVRYSAQPGDHAP